MTLVTELTPKQEAFVVHYVEHRNVNMAYRHAYDCSRMSANTVNRSGYELLRHPGVKVACETRIAEARALANANIAFTLADAMNRLLDTVEADPDELIGLRVGCCRYCHGEGHRYQWADHEYLAAVARIEEDNARPERKGPEAPLPDPAGGFGWDHTLTPSDDCPECRGEGLERIVARDTSKLSRKGKMLYRGVKPTRNGIEVLMADQGKALENLVRMMGGFDDKLRVDATLAARVAAVTAPAATVEEAVRAYSDLLTGGS